MTYFDKLMQIDALKNAIEQSGTLPKELQSKINYKFRLEWNYTSNSMEGNSLTRQETRSIMIGNITVGGKPIKDILEMKGHDEEISNIMKMGKGELNISEKRIRDLHKAIIHEDDPARIKMIGQWKKDQNYLDNYKGERFYFVPPADVPERMHKLINWLNAEKEKIARDAQGQLHPVMLAIQFHLDYVSIHPFYDGNGRTARILTNIILISYGYPPMYIKENEKNIYYQYLADIQGYGGQPDLFYDFMCDMLLRSMQLVLDAIEGREIEEADDWEKQLKILKASTNKDNEVKIVRSKEALLQLANHTIIPFIDKLLEKFIQFEELFIGKMIFITTDNDSMDIVSGSDILPLITDDRNRLITRLGFKYYLQGFKRSDTNTFAVSVTADWSFDTYSYSVKVQPSKDSREQWFLYHYTFSEAQIDDLIRQCGTALISQIETNIN